MGHFEENLLSKLPNTWLSSNMQDEVSKMLLKLWTLISEDLSVLCQMGQNTASLLVSLSRSWCCHPTRKENDDKKQKKAQDNLSSVFTLRRFRPLGEILIAAEVEEDDYLRGEKVKIKEKIICVCVCVCIYVYTHIYRIIISGWSGVSFTFWSGEHQPQKLFQNRWRCFLLLESSSPPAVPTAEVKSLLYFLLYPMWMLLHALRSCSSQ